MHKIEVLPVAKVDHGVRRLAPAHVDQRDGHEHSSTGSNTLRDRVVDEDLDVRWLGLQARRLRGCRLSRASKQVFSGLAEPRIEHAEHRGLEPRLDRLPHPSRLSGRGQFLDRCERIRGLRRLGQRGLESRHDAIRRLGCEPGAVLPRTRE